MLSAIFAPSVQRAVFHHTSRPRFSAPPRGTTIPSARSLRTDETRRAKGIAVAAATQVQAHRITDHPPDSDRDDGPARAVKADGVSRTTCRMIL
jgi:hypothetical protein